MAATRYWSGRLSFLRPGVNECLNKNRVFSRGLMALFALMVLVLCGGMGLAGFFLGRGSTPVVEASDEEVAGEVVVVTNEVTREVEVTVPSDSQSDAKPLATPTLPPVVNEESVEAVTDDSERITQDDDPTPFPTATFAAGEIGDFDEADLELLLEAWAFIEAEYDGEIPQ